MPQDPWLAYLANMGAPDDSGGGTPAAPLEDSYGGPGPYSAAPELGGNYSPPDAFGGPAMLGYSPVIRPPGPASGHPGETQGGVAGADRPNVDYKPPPAGSVPARAAGSDNGDIAGYIRAAAMQRGIDPEVALRIAASEGGTEERARQGTFNTGRSWWPFQLHYGGAGTPYAQWGNTAGMGNDFTAATGYQPGDPNAWQASIDYALDHARRYGWGAWYGRKPAGVGEWDGIPR